MNKSILKFILILSLSVIICACENTNEAEQKEYTMQMQKVQAKEQTFQRVFDGSNLAQLKQMSEDNITDINKRTLEDLNQKMNQKILPAFKKYQKEAKKLPETNQTLKSLKLTYLQSLEGKEKEIKKVQQLIRLCMDSVEANESVLTYAQHFETYRANVESYMNQARSTEAGYNESLSFEAVLNDNYQEVQKLGEKYSDTQSDKEQQAMIKNEMLPLIQKQIKVMNQKRIHHTAVNQARQNAIEMYYNLEHYYRERAETIRLHEQLLKINSNDLVTSSKELEKYERTYQSKANQKLK